MSNEQKIMSNEQKVTSNEQRTKISVSRMTNLRSYKPQKVVKFDLILLSGWRLARGNQKFSA